jgi:hypothetical protein
VTAIVGEERRRLIAAGKLQVVPLGRVGPPAPLRRVGDSARDVAREASADSRWCVGRGGRRRRRVARLVRLLVLVAVLILAPARVRAVCGDVNGDGVVDIGDALAIAQCDVGMRSCDFPLATPCGPSTTTTTTTPTTTTTTTTLPFYATAEPFLDPSCPDVCALVQWAAPCDPNAGPCPPEAVIEIARSPDGLSGWTTVLSQSAAGQSSFMDTGLTAQTAYYYRVRLLP